ncbi:unnamed protein product [Brassica napus]|uniref:(rape) hypothetical protein n=1 Tax=Brassica napus TaxID=3708 RepID=A0A816SBB4_BRANA|nr:unnamed protein product [Brassica napus]
MSSSYNNTISSSSTQSFPILAIGANNFNREETAMTMNQRPNSVSPPPRRLRNKPGNPSKYLLLTYAVINEVSDSYETHRAFCEALAQESAGNPNLSFTEMLAAAGGSDGSSRHGLYGGASSGLSHNHFGDNSNSGFAPPAAGFNLNRSSSPKFEDFFPQSTNPNHGPTTNFPMQYPSNQGLLARNDQNLMNQHGLINSNNNNNNLFNPGYFQANTQNLSDQTGGPPLFHHADNNVPSALLRGSSMAANNFGGSGNSNFQGQMNSLAATSGHQGRPGSSIFDHRLGNNLSIGGPDRRTLDFLGVNGRGGRSEPPLDLDMKFSDPNNPFGNV